MTARAPLRLLVVNEGVLGHTSGMAQLTGRLQERPDIEVKQLTVPPAGPVARRLVARSRRLGDLDLQLLRWRLRWSWEARRLLQAHRDQADAALVHTQACASLSAGIMRRLPCVLSVDATVRQYMALGYRPPDRFSGRVTELMGALETRALRAATGVMAWTRWTRDALVAEHGVEPTRVAVIHPGVDPELWGRSRSERSAGGALRILFVGNDVRRKGLDLLAEAAGRLDGAHVDAVTGDQVPSNDRLRVHRGVAPRSPELHRLYDQADVFALPTLGDAVPNVVVEAMASGLPVVASDVGAVREMVGDAGIVIPAGDVEALSGALSRLADDPGERRALGRRARVRVSERYESSTEAARLADWLHSLAREGAPW
jgi:glycosyltransferase involved in cell wall biosynthesis